MSQDSGAWLPFSTSPGKSRSSSPCLGEHGCLAVIVTVCVTLWAASGQGVETISSLPHSPLQGLQNVTQSKSGTSLWHYTEGPRAHAPSPSALPAGPCPAREEPGGGTDPGWPPLPLQDHPPAGLSVPIGVNLRKTGSPGTRSCTFLRLSSPNCSPRATPSGRTTDTLLSRGQARPAPQWGRGAVDAPEGFHRNLVSQGKPRGLSEVTQGQLGGGSWLSWKWPPQNAPILQSDRGSRGRQKAFPGRERHWSLASLAARSKRATRFPGSQPCWEISEMRVVEVTVPWDCCTRERTSRRAAGLPGVPTCGSKERVGVQRAGSSVTQWPCLPTARRCRKDCAACYCPHTGFTATPGTGGGSSENPGRWKGLSFIDTGPQ